MMMTAGWVPMMAAMMVPSAVPAIARRAHDRDGAIAAPLFAGSYVVIWIAVGLAAYELYRPPGDLAADALVIAGGLYELSPFKLACRQRCRERLRSGTQFGIACVGSSVGLMLILAGVGLMSMVWMVAIAAIVLAQKLFAPYPPVDVTVTIALVALALI
jgi:predicted metal-binding membrane protein